MLTKFITRIFNFGQTKDDSIFSIRNFILRAIMINVTIALSLASIAFITNNIISFRTSLKNELSSISGLLTYNLITSLEFQDDKDALKILESLSTDQDISSATILNPDGTVLVNYGIQLNFDPKHFLSLTHKINEGTGEFYENKYFYTKSIIKKDGTNLGTLVIAHNLTSLNAQYSNFAWIALLVILICSLLAYFNSKRFQKSITQPIDQFVEIITNITQKGNYSLRTKSQTEHIIISEIKNLANNFDVMLEQIESRDCAINEAYNVLEDKVKERTADLVKAQQDLITSTSRLATLGEMSASIAHEINNPLSVITMSTSKIINKLKKHEISNEDIILTTQKIQKMTAKIANIVKGLRNFSRDGSQDPFDTVQLKSIIEDTLEICADRFKSANVNLRVSEIPNIYFDCRATQVGQVFMNLLNNAFDAIQAIKDKWVQVDFESDKQHLKLIITDCGNGIPENIRIKIMEPFFTTKGVGKGTGLGLSISRSIIESHQGTLTIDSNCENTRFVITLPIHQASENISPTKKSA